MRVYCTECRHALVHDSCWISAVCKQEEPVRRHTFIGPAETGVLCFRKNRHCDCPDFEPKPPCWFVRLWRWLTARLRDRRMNYTGPR